MWSTVSTDHHESERTETAKLLMQKVGSGPDGHVLHLVSLKALIKLKVLASVLRQLGL